MPLRSGVVFVAAPNSDVQLVGTTFKTGAAEPRISPPPSIDNLLESIADQFGKLSVGIVPSGAEPDGVPGIESVPRAGGHHPDAVHFCGRLEANPAESEQFSTVSAPALTVPTLRPSGWRLSASPCATGFETTSSRSTPRRRGAFALLLDALPDEAESTRAMAQAGLDACTQPPFAALG